MIFLYERNFENDIMIIIIIIDLNFVLIFIYSIIINFVQLCYVNPQFMFIFYSTMIEFIFNLCFSYK